MKRTLRRLLVLAVLGPALLALTPRTAAAAKDLCFTCTGGKIVAKAFKAPSRGKCGHFVAFLQGEFAPDEPLTLAACTTSDGTVVRNVLYGIGNWYRFSYYLPYPAFTGIDVTDLSGTTTSNAFQCNLEICPTTQAIR